MSDPRWVQHISGQGMRWRVSLELTEQWRCEPIGETDQYYYLPKSEYVLCAQPDRWVDVTEACGVESLRADLTHGMIDVVDALHHAYRLKKVQLAYLDGPRAGQRQWALLVERKEAP